MSEIVREKHSTLLSTLWLPKQSTTSTLFTGRLSLANRSRIGIWWHRSIQCTLWIAVVCASKAVAFAATMKQRAARMSYPLCMYVYLSNEVYMSIGNSRKCFRTPLTFYGSCLYYKKLRSQRNSSNELYTKVYSHLVTYHQQCWDKTRGNLSCTFLM